MTIDIEMTIEGLDELDNALANYSDKVVKKSLDSALSAGAFLIMKEARQLASISEHVHIMREISSGRNVQVQPGLLKSAIRRRKLKKGELSKINAEAGVAVYVGKSTKQKMYPRYWIFIEYGTAKLAPVPFLRPAFDRQKENAMNRFKEKLADNIAKLENS